MTDQVTREQAALARRDALKASSDGEDGRTVSRSCKPIDVGVARSLTFPTKLTVELVTRDTATKRANETKRDRGTTRYCPIKKRDVDCDDCMDQCDECSGGGDSDGGEESFWGGGIQSASGGWWSRSKDGDDCRVHLSGCASLTETPYEMWDAFGPYQERISRIAFAESLSRAPDVAFLANHEGLSMARTMSGSLRLSAPLNMEAWLNPMRTDVRNLVTAIRDGDVTQMSFGATLEEGTWNEAFTEFEMTRLNLDCGDVSAVNFGANPYTSIAVRSHSVLDEVGRLPEGTARTILRALEARFQLPARQPEQAAAGRSIALIRSALLAEDDG